MTNAGIHISGQLPPPAVYLYTVGKLRKHTHLSLNILSALLTQDLTRVVEATWPPPLECLVLLTLTWMESTSHTWAVSGPLLLTPIKLSTSLSPLLSWRVVHHVHMIMLRYRQKGSNTWQTVWSLKLPFIYILMKYKEMFWFFICVLLYFWFFYLLRSMMVTVLITHWLEHTVEL